MELAELDIEKATSFENIKKNNLVVEDDKIEIARKKIFEIAELIKSKTDSPYERHLLALHYIQQYIYTLDEDQPHLASRSLSEIIPNKGKFICCAGYARYYTEVMRAMGFEVRTQTALQHLRAKVFLKDEKYDIEGIFAVDPTWISRKKDENNPIFRFNKLANMSMKTIKEAYAEDIVKGKQNEIFAFKKLMSDLQKREFISLGDLVSYITGESVEKNLDYSAIIEHLEEKYKNNKNQVILGNDIVKKSLSILQERVQLLQEISFIENLNNIKDEKRKLHQMEKFLDYIEPIFKKMEFEDYENMEMFLSQNMMNKRIYYGSLLFGKYGKLRDNLNDYENLDLLAQKDKQKLFQSFKLIAIQDAIKSDEALFNFSRNEATEKAIKKYIQLKIENDELKKNFNENFELKKLLKQLADQELWKIFEPGFSLSQLEFRQFLAEKTEKYGIYLNDIDDFLEFIKSDYEIQLQEEILQTRRGEISGDIYHNGDQEDMQAMFDNFTSLTNEEYDKVFNRTQEIKDETLMKGVETIKKLVRAEDYKLFEQDLSGKGSHVDAAFQI